MPFMAKLSLQTMTEADARNMTDFIRKSVGDAGAKGAVVGISGGVDSAVVVKLCADALGGENVLAVFMPTASTPAEDFRQTKQMCQMWGVNYSAISIQAVVDTFAGMLLTGKEAPLEKGNIMSRCRMIVLYDKAKKEDYLVVGTTNRSELLMGYFTKFGDGAEDIMPMGNIFKTQVWELAEILGVPKEIIDKVPTAGLWEGQSDEDEMGIAYKDLDVVLHGIEAGADEKEILEATGISPEKYADIFRNIEKMAHKRMPALRPSF